MTNILSNVTQVINNSPQISSFVGGQMAAIEEAVRQGQLDFARRLEYELQKQVQALEKTERVTEFDPNDPQREETRRQRKNRLRADRERRRASARAARGRREALSGDSRTCSQTSPDQSQIIDICV